ncbi:hypothetical protein ACLKA6_018234 [Drosophila palustris]
MVGVCWVYFRRRDQMIVTFSDPCCRRINSAVLALAGNSAIFAAAGSTQQFLLWQDIQRSLLPQDQLSSPCFGRTFSDPCCRRINSAVLALAGHSAILAAAGSTQQSLLDAKKGTALKWYIANNEHWRTWTAFATSFQEFFLPRDYFTKLLEEVTRRKQGVDEPFKRYMVEMQTLMRPLRFSKERERQQIYSCSV